MYITSGSIVDPPVAYRGRRLVKFTFVDGFCSSISFTTQILLLFLILNKFCFVVERTTMCSQRVGSVRRLALVTLLLIFTFRATRSPSIFTLQCFESSACQNVFQSNDSQKAAAETSQIKRTGANPFNTTLVLFKLDFHISSKKEKSVPALFFVNTSNETTNGASSRYIVSNVPDNSTGLPHTPSA